jgi:hypothetical protein
MWWNVCYISQTTKLWKAREVVQNGGTIEQARPQTRGSAAQRKNNQSNQNGAHGVCMFSWSFMFSPKGAQHGF